MKIFVPQEQKQEIVNMYQQGKNRVQIKKELNLPFGDSVIKSVLEEFGCEIRTNPGAQKGGRKKQDVEHTLQKRIIDLYVNKEYGLDRIVKTLNLPFGSDKVKSILQDNDVHIRDNKEASKIVVANYDFRKYKINDNYDFETHNGAWLLGFLAADGYLPMTKGAKTRVTIAISVIDREILERIKKELEYTGPIYEYEVSLNNKNFPEVSLSFTSKEIRKKLESYGIVNNKTYLLKQIPQNLPQDLILDYVRGYIDGDGSIYYREGKVNKPKISITSANKEFIEDIDMWLHKLLPLQYNGGIYKDHNNTAVRYSIADSLIIGKALYDNDYLSLQRKKDRILFSLRESTPTSLNAPQG